MKTIFIPIFQGVEAKNILRTDIFRTLRRQKDLRIVLFVSNRQKEEYFKKEFSDDRLFYEVFNSYRPPSLNKVFTFLGTFLIRTKTMDIRRKVEFADYKNYKKYYSQLIFSRIFAFKFWRWIVRWLDWYLVKDENFKEVFDKYNPDLVFLAHLFGDEETSILRQAKKRGVKSIGLINSWDKITSRCMIRLLPDKLIVHNDIMKEEAIKYVDMPGNAIEIVGIPHYDVFVNSKPSPKEKFYNRIGADINKKLLVFCPLGKRYSDIDAEILEIILDFKNKNLIPRNTQILVRFPPNDIVDLGDLKSRDDLIFFQPGVRFTSGDERRVDWDMNDDDAQCLLDTLFYSSLLICQVSSLSIDAAVFDKPVINFRIKSRNITFPRDANWSFDLNHYQPLLDSGGVTVVKSKEELLEWVNKYLNNPKIDAEGRKIIVAEQCWKLDGRAGERTAKIILDAVYS